MTDTAIHREFLLTDNNAYRALQEFCRTFAPKCMEEKRPLRVIVVDEEQDRLDLQIAFYFGVLIKCVAEQVWVGESPRRQYSKETWHHYFAQKYLPAKEIELPTGQTILERQSIARGKIGVRAMAKFTSEVEVEAVQEFGVHLPARREQG